MQFMWCQGETIVVLLHRLPATYGRLHDAGLVVAIFSRCRLEEALHTRAHFNCKVTHGPVALIAEFGNFHYLQVAPA